MELLRGYLPGLYKKRNPLAGALHQFTVIRSSSLNANGSSVASASSRIEVQLRVRSCTWHGRNLQGVDVSSSLSPFASNLNSAKFFGKHRDCIVDANVKAHSSISCPSGVVSSAIEAHDLTLLQPGPWRVLDYSDPVQNEEAEEAIKVPLEDLRTLLRLWDIDNFKTDQYELLVVVDYLERLGLDVYFRQEIKSILDSIVRIWTENTSRKTAALLGNLQGVALAFYLLRSHEYNVQPSIFQIYRKEDGSFHNNMAHVAARDFAEPPVRSTTDVGALLNLLRASDLRFQGDEILQDVYSYASSALRSLLNGDGELISEESSSEVRHRLNCPWFVNLRMLETRQTILNLQVASTVTTKSSRLSSRAVSLMLYTATKLLNENVSLFQHEIQGLRSWSKESGLEEVNIRSDMVMLPAYLSIAYEMPQTKYAYTREVYAKIFYIFIILDDLYDVGASLEHLRTLNDAVRRWDPSILERMPKDQGSMSIRVLYKQIYNLTKSWAKQASIWYGAGDLLQTFITHWIVRLEMYLNERIWAETGYKLTLDEYMNEFSKWSFTCESGVPFAYYSIPWGKVSRSFFETRPDLKAVLSISKTARIFNDARSYKHEKFTESKGKTELIGILMEQNPQLTEEEAVEQVESYAQSSLQETTEEILCSGIAHPEIKPILLATLRVCIILNYTFDGLRNPDHVLSKLMEPLPNTSLYGYD